MYHHVKGLLLALEVRVKQCDLYVNSVEREWVPEATGFRWESIQDRI